jgi:hypothetical protein
MPWIPSANSGFINNITWTGKSLPLLAVSVNDVDRSIKCSVPSVHPSKTSTNLFGSRSLIPCCRTLNQASRLWRRVFFDTGFNIVILRVKGQSTNPTGRFFMITNSIHSNISLSVLLVLRTNPFSAFSCRALLYTVKSRLQHKFEGGWADWSIRHSWITLTTLLALPRLGIYFMEKIATNLFALGSLGDHGTCCGSHDGLDDWKPTIREIRMSYEHNKNGLNEILL